MSASTAQATDGDRYFLQDGDRYYFLLDEEGQFSNSPMKRVDDSLQAGRDAIKRRAWREAFDLLKVADTSTDLSSEDLESLARAAWCTGRFQDYIDTYERAYARYVERGNPRRAAYMFMFTDIVKSTTLVEAIGDEAWEDLMRWHDVTLRSLFAGHGGEEIDHAGDGFFVVFKTTTPAIECAVAIQRALADHRRLHGFSPQVRIGLHAAKATYRNFHYRGKGVHQAARIAALAEAGEILASQETVGTEMTRFAVSNPRKVTLKGISDPILLVAIDWH